EPVAEGEEIDPDMLSDPDGVLADVRLAEIYDDGRRWLAIGNAQGRDVADGWLVGMEDGSSRPGNPVMRLDDTTLQWAPIENAVAGRIGGTYWAPWMVDLDGNVAMSSDSGLITVGSGARDVGEGWMLEGQRQEDGGFAVKRFDFQTGSWVDLGISALRVGGSYNDPWLVGPQGDVLRWNGDAFQSLPGLKARDVAQGWAIGDRLTNEGYTIHFFDDATASWKRVQGGAANIGGTRDFPMIIGYADNRVYVFR
ncbi:MAG: hypothetical protein ACRBB0_13195, partial [Pelagimonas sp.]|uniref:hypothetical protein n=1 Tax=Pelagimonas sp. TaxID=2073170 RepID=UPI003D6B588F